MGRRIFPGGEKISPGVGRHFHSGGKTFLHSNKFLPESDDIVFQEDAYLPESDDIVFQEDEYLAESDDNLIPADDSPGNSLKLLSHNYPESFRQTNFPPGQSPEEEICWISEKIVATK